MKNQICIICGTEFAENSIEHIVPEAIGGKARIECVCRQCNNKLGDKVDCLLTEDPVIIYIRHLLGIKNRDGKKVDIVKAFDFCDGAGEKVILKRGDGSQMPYLYDGTKTPKVTITQINDNRIHVQWEGSDIESVFKKAKRELKKLNRVVSDEELERFLFSSMNVSAGYIPARAEITMKVNQYLPCICKIAFETAHKVLGDEYLVDPLGMEYKNLLYNLAYDNRPNDVHELVDFEFDWHSISAEQRAYLLRDEGKIHAYITLLGSFRFHICVTHNADKYCFNSGLVVDVPL